MSDDLNMREPGRPRRWLHRGRQVAQIFAHYGFAPVMQRLGLGRFVPRKAGAAIPEAELPSRLRLALEDLGPVAVKLGQLLASRPDLLPRPYVTELRKLEDAVETFPFEKARRVIESELGMSLSEAFAEFGEEPAAAASLAQVHKARLHSGEVVAVKVQRPDAQEVVETDLQILIFLGRIAERYSRAFQQAGVSELVYEFAYYIRNELDFYVEGHNTDRLREALSDIDFARVPAVYWDYTSKRVITTQWFDGIHANDLEALVAAGIDPRRTAHRIAALYIHETFGIGYFHGDPHGGNILVQPDEVIVLLDCGNVHSISRYLREAFTTLTAALLRGDSEALAQELLDLGVVSDTTHVEALFQDVDRMLSRYASIRSSEVRVGEAMDQLLALVLKHQIRVPPVVGAISRATVITEGVCRQLDPHFDFREVAAETLPDALPGGPFGHVLRKAASDARMLGRLATALPRQAARFLMKANAGGARVKIEIEDIDQHLRRLDVMANRMAFALVVAAFIIASAWIVSSERAIESITPIGGALYAAMAGAFGLWLLYSIIRSGRL